MQISHNKRINSIGLCLIIVFLTISSSTTIASNLNENTIDSSPQSSILMDPVSIVGEVALNSFIGSLTGVTGTGTENDPYVISDIELNSLGNSFRAFSIVDLSQYIIFRNLKIGNFVNDSTSATLVFMNNCSNIVFENVIFENILMDHPSVADLFGFYIMGSESVKVSNLVCNNLTAIKVEVFSAVNGKDIGLYSSSISDIRVSISTDLIFYSGSHGGVLENVVIDNISQEGLDFLILLSIINADNFTTQNNQFRNINGLWSVLVSRFENSSNTKVLNNIYSNISGKYAYNTLIDISNCEFRNNVYENFQIENEINLFYFAGDCPDNLLVGNRIQDFQANVMYIFLSGTSVLEHSIIKENIITGNIKSDAFYAVLFGANTNNNKFYRNLILNGSGILAVDHGTDNQFSVIDYFEPMNAMTMVGNYWCDHNIDSEPLFHYFVNTPRAIYGAANNSDQRPLHYNSIDFSDESINGGEPGGDETNQIRWEELYQNPTNWGLGAILIAIIVTNIPFKKKK